MNSRGVKTSIFDAKITAGCRGSYVLKEGINTAKL
jgi:hypothetical protein